MSRLMPGLLVGVALAVSAMAAGERFLAVEGVRSVNFIDPGRYAQAADNERTALAVEEELRTSLLRDRDLPPLLTALTIKVGGIPQICRTRITAVAEAAVSQANCQPATTARDHLLVRFAELMLYQRSLKHV
ncbi:MAG TPA: hypothetical protein VHP58_03215 [Alphaproteobacteria bacterium]|nr:hypothetical protein [Alphaproteobacteria bacterium]